MSKDTSHLSYRSTISTRLQQDSINLVFLDDLSDRELVDIVEKTRTTNKRLEVESDVWYNFLLKSDPRLLRGLDKVLHMTNAAMPSTVPQLQSQVSVALPPPPPSVAAAAAAVMVRAESFSSFTSQQSNLSCRRSSLIGSWLSGSSNAQRVNLQTRMELVRRDREHNELTSQSFLGKSRVRRASLRSQLEELALEVAEIREARDIFDQTILRDGVDPLTGRVPAEKFIRYMEEWLKSADSIVEKLRLRTSTLHYRFVSLRHQLAQKEELGESLHPVDFDQMKIENSILVERIDSKNGDLLRLKHKTGGVNLQLARKKRYLLRQLARKHGVQLQIEECRRKRRDIEQESAVVESELAGSAARLGDVRALVSRYSVPDLIDYVRVKKELAALRQTVKVWSRRNHLQKIALDSCVKTMRRLTGSKEESESWYKPVPRAADEDF